MSFQKFFLSTSSSFLTFSIFVITSCAFEAFITPFLNKYHYSLKYQTFFWIESLSKFSRNSASVFESFIWLSMLVTSTSVSSVQSVIISQTRSILGFGTAVKSILFGTISSKADAKSISGNGFLSDLANGCVFALVWLQVVFSFYHAVQNLLYQSLSL